MIAISLEHNKVFCYWNDGLFIKIWEYFFKTLK